MLTFVSGPDEIVKYFCQIEQENHMRSMRSKFPIGTRVRVTSDITKIASKLMCAYNRHDAFSIARDLAGSICEVISVDELYDENGVKGTYYSIETSEGMMYSMLEDYLSGPNTSR